MYQMPLIRNVNSIQMNACTRRQIKWSRPITWLLLRLGFSFNLYLNFYWVLNSTHGEFIALVPDKSLSQIRARPSMIWDWSNVCFSSPEWKQRKHSINCGFSPSVWQSTEKMKKNKVEKKPLGNRQFVQWWIGPHLYQWLKIVELQMWSDHPTKYLLLRSWCAVHFRVPSLSQINV